MPPAAGPVLRPLLLGPLFDTIGRQVSGHSYLRLLWGAAAIVLAAMLGRILKWLGSRLDERPLGEERELARLRRRETIVVLVATAIPYATTIVVVIILASLFLPTAATLGGSAFIGVVVAFAAQRFLMDVVAGGLIAFERWSASATS